MIKQIQAPKQANKVCFSPAVRTVVKNNQIVTKVKDGITEGRLDLFDLLNLENHFVSTHS